MHSGGTLRAATDFNSTLVLPSATLNLSGIRKANSTTSGSK